MSNNLTVSVASLAHVGNVRSSQQDVVVILPSGGIVADGMGGTRGGEVASKICGDVVTALYHKAPPTTAAEARSFVQAALIDADQSVVNEASADPSLRKMGSTCSVVVWADDTLFVAGIGDSPVYHWRAGALKELTWGHSFADSVVRRGGMTEEEARSSRLANVLYKYAGMVGDPLAIDPEDCSETILASGDRFLACSDGITKHLTNARIEEILAQNDDPQVTAQTLVDEALAGGGSDNIAVLVGVVR